MALYELNIEDYWKIIRRRRYIIIGTFFVVLLGTWIFTEIQTPIYQSSSTLKVGKEVRLSELFIDWAVAGGGAIATEMQVIRSQAVAQEVGLKLGLISPTSTKEKKLEVGLGLLSKISVGQVEGSNIIRITATSSDPKETVILANTFAEVYYEYSYEQRLKHTRKVKEFTEQQLDEIKQKLADAESELETFLKVTKIPATAKALVDTLINRLVELESKRTLLLKTFTSNHPQVKELDEEIGSINKKLNQLPANEVELGRLTREVKVYDELYTMFNKKFKDIEIAEADKEEIVTLLDSAIEPTTPIKPNKPLNMILGSFVGIIFGLSLAFVREALDTSIGTIEDVESYLNLPVLGVIPHISETGEVEPAVWNRIFGLKLRKIAREEKISSIRKKLIVNFTSSNSFVEAYHTLLTNVKFATIQNKLNSLLFTSAGPREGKTVCAINFCLGIASQGLRVILIESDLRRPSISKLFGLSREPGLTDVLLGNIPLTKAIRGTTDFLLGELELDKLLKFPGIENFKILTSGKLPPNPIEVLSSDEMSGVIDELKNNFDFVVFDTPPIMSVVDATILAPYVGGCILVYEVGRIVRGALKRTKLQIENANGKVIGLVLNNISITEMKPIYGYYYSYKYYGEKKPESKKKK